MENLTIEQRKFLNLAVIEQKTYAEIEKLLNIDRSTISKLWDELKIPREELSAIRRIWQQKCKDLDKYEFIEWYLNTQKKCYYCNLTQEDNNRLWILDPKLTKRNRGRSFEIDRKLPNELYDNIHNLVFSCYWCNNAKTDTFTEEEFKKIIGPSIEKVWRNRLD